ncbi:ASCH domain-containing protein [Burkholderia cenocepacia]|uniref:ASCH domain-containing protein n=1 Tax=Burkholderia cenocepacia TaxID=95486 RepID=UPI001B9F2321|nr:ASCH domain-containing protein [Burkholderia cenocepacia]MBR8443104.1 ASCH domain-containing protein [Burkholderia cenocepacia]
MAKSKRATCSLLWSRDFDGERLSQEEDVEIILDSRNRPVLMLQTKKGEIVPFGEASCEFTAAEGEGDLSLEYRRAEH